MLYVENLVKNFGQLAAVDGVSLEVPAGRIVGLIGPNGSGKSTLLSLIAGEQRPDAGRITFDGQEISGRTPDAIFRAGLVRSYQNPSLFFRMTVLDNALLPVKGQKGESALAAPLHRIWAKQEEEIAAAASHQLDEIGLRGHYDVLAAELSGGQMKLLELGRSLMGAPKLLLLDEPTAGVAPNLAYSIFEQIAALRAGQGLSFLIVEHRLEILFDFVDDVYVMHLSKVIAHGPPQAIIDNQEVREVYFGE